MPPHLALQAGQQAVVEVVPVEDAGGAGKVAAQFFVQFAPRFADQVDMAAKPLADKALAMLDVDLHGLDVMDRKLLEAVIHRFDGGPVGLDNVAAAIGEERETIEDVIEPYLIQQGYLQRTPRGRVATLAAFRHLGVTPTRAATDLFDN